MDRKKALLLTTTILFSIGLCVFCYIWFYARFYQYTDDAYVDGNKILITPQISGIVTDITADDTDFVSENRLLISLDTTNYQLALDLACSDLAARVRDVAELFEKVKQLEGDLIKKKALFVNAAQDFEHRQDLIATAAISLEDLEHATALLQATFGDLTETEYALYAALDAVGNTTVSSHPLVMQAKENLVQAYVNLNRCDLLSPVSGLVAQRKVQVGSQVAMGEPLLAVIPLDQMWITANFKETQLSKMRLFQRATVFVDLWGDSVTYRGKVIGIGGGTGSVFSVLPPQNATGNWIKIVQRVPVRIALDPEDLRKHPLRLGLSCEVTVDVHDTQDPLIPSEKPEKAIYSTPIYSEQTEGVENLIQFIIEHNSVSHP